LDSVFAVTRVGLLADFARLATQSLNLSNVDTVGYKRQLAVTSSFDARLDNVLPSGDTSMAATTTLTDPRAGALKQTGRPLDLSLDGDGFFGVRTASGIRYTRRGDFAVEASGRLVTAAGDAVLAGGGDVVLPGTAVTVDRDGKIFDGDRQLTQLDIVQFADPGRLQYVGGGLFDAAGQAPLATVTATRVRSGALEASNVQPAHEMIGLLEVSREVQLTRSVLTARDEMLDSAANTLAQF